MGKLLVQKYTTNPDLPRVRGPIVIPAEKKRCVEVPISSEGLIKKIVLFQSDDGDPVELKLWAFDSKTIFAPGLHDLDVEPAHRPELYEVFEQVTNPPGEVLRITDESAYHNQDGSYSSTPRALYFLLEPVDATEETSWDMAVYTENTVG